MPLKAFAWNAALKQTNVSLFYHYKYSSALPPNLAENPLIGKKLLISFEILNDDCLIDLTVYGFRISGRKIVYAIGCLRIVSLI